MQSTSRDYADMVNPHVRAEQEAHKRGYQRGLFHAAIYVIALCFLAVVFS